MIICPNCNHENDDEEQVCQECGLRFRLPATHSIPVIQSLESDPEINPPEPPVIDGPFDVVLHVPTANANINLPDAPEVLLGRFGTDAPDEPYIDLNEFGAHHKGVSRIHASIKRDDDHVLLKDRHSANGTFVNGKLVEQGAEAPLNHGDEVRLGALILDIRFEQ